MVILGELALHRAHDVHHLREAFDDHQLGRPDAPGRAHTSDVVAREVHQHRVLRLLLGVGEQLVLEQPVAHLGLAARTRAGDRPGGHPPALHADQRLRRGSRQLHAQHPHEEHVRRRVRDAQPPVDGEAALGRRERDAARRHPLEDVAGEDVLLERRHDLAVGLVGHVRLAGVQRSRRARLPARAVAARPRPAGRPAPPARSPRRRSRRRARARPGAAAAASGRTPRRGRSP